MLIELDSTCLLKWGQTDSYSPTGVSSRRWSLNVVSPLKFDYTPQFDTESLRLQWVGSGRSLL